MKENSLSILDTKLLLPNNKFPMTGNSNAVCSLVWRILERGTVIKECLFTPPVMSKYQILETLQDHSSSKNLMPLSVYRGRKCR